MKQVGPTSPHARRLRRDGTDVEQRLWLDLRDRRLGGFKFRRQATIGPFVVDFLSAQKGLVVELDGGQHSEEVDGDRTRCIEAGGYRVVRFWNNEVLENREGVLTAILDALNAAADRFEGPSPNPLPRAGEG